MLGQDRRFGKRSCQFSTALRLFLLLSISELGNFPSHGTSLLAPPEGSGRHGQGLPWKSGVQCEALTADTLEPSQERGSDSSGPSFPEDPPGGPTRREVLDQWEGSFLGAGFQPRPQDPESGQYTVPCERRTWAPGVWGGEAAVPLPSPGGRGHCSSSWGGENWKVRNLLALDPGSSAPARPTSSSS